jgi:hypothetical protein
MTQVDGQAENLEDWHPSRATACTDMSWMAGRELVCDLAGGSTDPEWP